MGKSSEQVLNGMRMAAKEGDMVELRLDGLERIELDELLPFHDCPLIVTNRRSEEGGFFSGSEVERISHLKKACEYGVDFVDVEWETPGNLRHELMAHRGRTKVILSYHEQKETPALERLLSLWREMSASGADVVKIIPYAKKIGDSLTVLNFLSTLMKSEKGGNIISHCMGEAGKISRVLSPMFGSIMAFASLEGSGKTAPGQMTAAQMKQAWEAMKP
jgi:3-dehydroquinate dehydratase type I